MYVAPELVLVITVTIEEQTTYTFKHWNSFEHVLLYEIKKEGYYPVTYLITKNESIDVEHQQFFIDVFNSELFEDLNDKSFQRLLWKEICPCQGPYNSDGFDIDLDIEPTYFKTDGQSVIKMLNLNKREIVCRYYLMNTPRFIVYLNMAPMGHTLYKPNERELEFIKHLRKNGFEPEICSGAYRPVQVSGLVYLMEEDKLVDVDCYEQGKVFCLQYYQQPLSVEEMEVVRDAFLEFYGLPPSKKRVNKTFLKLEQQGVFSPEKPLLPINC